MKNKTKKLLTGVCLSIVGAGCLAGCSMSDEQKAALDLITEKSDAIVNLLEENMQLNNNKLSKEEAYEKILIAVNRIVIGNIDQLHISQECYDYYGVFDGIEESAGNGKSDVYFRKNGDEKFIVTSKNDNINGITLSNFSTNKHYSWETGQTNLQERTYSHDDFLLSRYDLSQDADLGSIAPEDIYDIVINKDSYDFKVLYISEAEKGVMEISVSKTGYLLQVKYESLEKSGLEGNYNAYKVNIKYSYDNIDFSVVDSKIASLQA